MEVVHRNTETVLEGIRSSNHRVIKKLYDEAYPMITKLLSTNNAQNIESQELLQEAMIVLYEKSIDPEFELSCAPTTFLYAVSKNILLKKLRKVGKEIELNDSHNNQFKTEIDAEEDIILNERQKLLQRLLDTVGQSCKKILSLYYVESLKFEEIANKLNYTNADNAKNQKYKCLKKLRASLKNSNKR